MMIYIEGWFFLLMYEIGGRERNFHCMGKKKVIGDAITPWLPPPSPRRKERYHRAKHEPSPPLKEGILMPPRATTRKGSDHNAISWLQPPKSAKKRLQCRFAKSVPVDLMQCPR